ncbi:PREDICTED: retinal-specific ATP-binding cassette transporter-like [Priapulus caudatus]|uniref:Retinal-specific ATP-binding cassette transporter-like n=1 Tax=Priapulus caudatus TaxID=37621 RepID=A0ABM1DQ34_PRICU|nr:PREDICTED: retinal-specific ATP-binding cassette transporter-like [Priapulus caudatus]
MAYWRTLKLLLWKNFVLRKRQKIRLVVELVWPLVLFLILVWVKQAKQDELKTFYHNCHFESKAMPSAGVGTWVQSQICTYNNTCHEYPVQKDRNRNDTMGILAESLFVDLSGIAEDRGTDIFRLLLLNQDVEKLRTLSGKIDNVTAIVPAEGIVVEKLMLEPSALRDLVTSEGIPLSSSTVDAVMASRLNPLAFAKDPNDAIAAFSRDPRSTLCNATVLAHYLVFPDEATGQAVSDDSCTLTDDQLVVMATEFFVQLNTTAVIEQMSVMVALNSGGDTLNVAEWEYSLTTLVSVFKEVIELNSFAALMDTMTGSSNPLTDASLDNNTSQLVAHCCVEATRQSSQLYRMIQTLPPISSVASTTTTLSSTSMTIHL